ncbi:TetR family transcriptional regulator [Kitasatospora sp. SolWspMP-SS2h]|uniref:TetR/AcrR family transcriptional regulator n=1 Tax=Kitasatospora sp. SolWspMP-SS2h TaxID=1305729 RepID=UPI000DB9F8BF|nr:TetR family transcriptional regulator [Kitasatospora sp. SolWspMP-SS2h]RAJ47014.1 TetR family transcriptional regulator [Kitasatospora sp. SolWspMP-SS2h]
MTRKSTGAGSGPEPVEDDHGGDGGSTRARLIRSAERAFAARGVHGAQLREVVRGAGQANPSAVQYHFGSREGLLDAVMAERQRRTERALAERLPRPEGCGLGELLGALVDAESTELRTERGRDCLRISTQVSHRSGIRERRPHAGLTGTLYWRLILALEEPLVALAPEPVRLERIDLALTLIGAALAERARQLAEGEPTLSGDRAYLADLVSVCTGLLTAPVP